MNQLQIVISAFVVAAISMGSGSVLRRTDCSLGCKTHTTNTLSGSGITVTLEPTTGNGLCDQNPPPTPPNCLRERGCKLEGKLILSNGNSDRWYTHGGSTGRVPLSAGSNITQTWDAGNTQVCDGGLQDQYYFYDAETGGNFLGSYRIYCTYCDNDPGT
jgi:hypothetical protein